MSGFMNTGKPLSIDIGIRANIEWTITSSFSGNTIGSDGRIRIGLRKNEWEILIAVQFLGIYPKLLQRIVALSGIIIAYLDGYVILTSAW